MLFYFFYPLTDWWFGFNVFKYITFRAAGASVTSFLLTLIIAPVMIAWLQRMRVGQTIRQANEVGKLFDLHSHKAGTPTMGGLLILFALVGSTLLWADPLNLKVQLVLGVTLSLGAIGFWDDWAKLRSKTSKGVRKRIRFSLQSLVVAAFASVLVLDPTFSTTLQVPFLKDAVCVLGWGLIPFAILVVVGASNAVNLSDGLDGLAVGCTAFVAVTLVILSYLTGHKEFADYLLIPYLPEAGELTVFCAALLGACLGFLWYNAQPAHVFMGDTGSLALGGAIGTVVVLLKKEILLILLGGIFVAEAMSVILQVASFRLLGKRIFLMAPLHHHFQLKGWEESKVTIRFWIIAAILAMLTLSTLKLR